MTKESVLESVCRDVKIKRNTMGSFTDTKGILRWRIYNKYQLVITQLLATHQQQNFTHITTASLLVLVVVS